MQRQYGPNTFSARDGEMGAAVKPNVAYVTYAANMLNCYRSTMRAT
jgi:hypothetical protein